ncbi:winged helix-turn-helix transcriptional regulator [Streptomyces sp. NPDC087659]|uniref:winged helix-turn-helix transcriptional regulator n=1 Tax=Streptomyces sp. NPDC087659 TaxID=3365801 RepID=UPI0037FDF9C9
MTRGGAAGFSRWTLTTAAKTAEDRVPERRPLTVPSRVEYTLTEPGRALRVTISGLCDWTQQFLGQIEASRHRFDTGR